MTTDFSDLVWLLTSLPSSRGIMRLNLGEAALLWKHAKRAQHGKIEVGRLYGGSTCLLAAASDAPVTSIDLSDSLDPKCKLFLADRDVELLTVNSRTVVLSRKYDFAFIDGDHSYEGVKADFDRIAPSLLPGSSILFHDAVKGSYGACKGVVRLVEELTVSGAIQQIETADSLLAAVLLYNES